ncbi:MAG: hypothetical protein D9V44_07885 [Actinobacteria bacterium]|nr:MAG: hypothetical protein D9V44_07885 [Actinomycetota bacterium]
MLQASEVIDLVIAVVLLPIIVSSRGALSARRRSLLFVAYASIIAAYTFTIAEGFFWFDALNLLEHAAYAVAGVLLVIALVDYRRHPSPEGQL